MFWVGFQCNTTFPIVKSIYSSLIFPAAGDTPVIYAAFSTALLSALTLTYKGKVTPPCFKPAS